MESLTSLNLKVCGLDHGLVGPILLLLFIGPLPRSRSSVSISALATWKRLIGARALMQLIMYLVLGDSVFYPSRVDHW